MRSIAGRDAGVQQRAEYLASRTFRPPSSCWPRCRPSPPCASPSCTTIRPGPGGLSGRTRSVPPAPPAGDDACRFTDKGDIEIVRGVMDRNDRLAPSILREAPTTCTASSCKMRRSSRCGWSCPCRLRSCWWFGCSRAFPARSSVWPRPRPALPLWATTRSASRSSPRTSWACFAREFNCMLDHVDASDKALKAANDAP